MGSLYVGANAIAVDDAIHQVNENIQELQLELDDVIREKCASVQRRKFYEDKIESQRITLQWLSRAL